MVSTFIGKSYHSPVIVSVKTLMKCIFILSFMLKVLVCRIVVGFCTSSHINLLLHK